MEFDDHPENYWAWKTSFQSVIDELALTPREELDLLIKWLRPVSKEQAKIISHTQPKFSCRAKHGLSKTGRDLW